MTYRPHFSFNIFYLVLFFICCTFVQAQNTSIIEETASSGSANEKFSQRNYAGALKEYLLLLKQDSKNGKYNFRAGICYLMSNINKAKAVPYLEIASRSAGIDEDVLFHLGRAYHVAYRFEEAIASYKKFKESGAGSTDAKNKIDRYMQYSYNAKELVKYPLNVSFANLGSAINSMYADYAPYVPANESFMIYNSRRKDTGIPFKNGNYTSTVFISNVTDGKFTNSKPLGNSINTGIGDDEVVGLSSNGEVLLLTYSNNMDYASLHISKANEPLSFGKASRLPKEINSGAMEFSGSVTSDGNSIYFVSSRAGGFGGGDIYVTRKLPNGKWAVAENLGPLVNTADEEDYPNISPDGKTLFFSSNGRSSMGGFDIFSVSRVDSTEKWGNLKNFGYPINTPDDDRNLRLSEDGRHGYISAVREGGYGDLDIYRVDFNDVEPRLMLQLGKILPEDESQKLNYSDILISITDNATNEIFGNYVPNPNSGRYVIILPVGEYTLTAEYSGYKNYEEKILVEESVGGRVEIYKNIVLSAE